jgi:PAS domain S-box-containing protein
MNKISEDPEKKRDYLEPTIFASIVFGIYISSSYSFLIFHTIAELFSIIIAGGVFVIAWNSRKNIDNSFFLVIGISFLFIGFIDLLHTLAYAGMNIFIGYDANLPTQLWILGRYLQALSFLLGSLLVNKKLKPYYLTVGYSIVSILLVSLIFIGLFPDAYIVGSGLTPFKIISEYIINLILFVTIFILYKFRNAFDRKVLILIIASIIATMVAELAFTFYVSVYGISNLVGHIFKIIAFYLLYKSIIRIGLESPFDLVYRQLKTSEQRITLAYSELDQMFNAALPIRIIDKDCKIIKVNDTFSSLFKLKREELLGKKCFEILPHEFCHTDTCSRNQILSGKEKVTYETEQYKADGTKITLMVDSIPYKSPKGEFLGLIQNYTDITDRKKAEEQVQYQAKLVENVSDAIISTDLDFNIISWNKAAESIYGWMADEIIGKNVMDTITVHYINDKQEDVLKQFFEKGFWKGEIIQPRKDGSFINIASSVSLLNDISNKPIGAVAINKDITERKKAEEKIINLSKFPSENPYPVLRVSKKAIIYTNKAGEDIFKIAINDKIPPILREDVEKVLSNKILNTVERTVNGKVYSFVITPVEGVSYINIYGTDITERRKAENRLEQLISTVSHELRTPITVILMSLDFLKNQKETITPEIEEQLMDGISRNTSLLHELAEDILTISRIDEKKIALELAEYSPHELINEILALLEPIYKEKNLDLETDVDENIRLKGDPKRIDHIFRIIIDNTIKYSNINSKIEIKAFDNYNGKYNPKERSGVLIQFKDTGIGIPAKDIPFIFERFFRSDHVKDISGTGLGLSIAKDLVELHNGTIHVESEVGKGSTFLIFLPKNET